MDKQKEIERMYVLIDEQNGDGNCGLKLDCCRILVNAGYGDVKQYQEEIIDLTAKLEVAERDKANLERTIEEMNEVIIIDCDGNVIDNRGKQAVREFAEKLKSLPQFEEIYPDEQVFISDMKSAIDELVKEVCGE